MHLPKNNKQNSLHKRSHPTAVHDMPPTDLAEACLLGHDTPIRPRNPYIRGTAKHTRRQNVNRNVRLLLRNDRKQTYEDSRVLQQVDSHHHILIMFYWHLMNGTTVHGIPSDTTKI